ncbi:MAG: GH92 family glycosyl hydrolase [Saprospiraceae bacterium]|nr:GH92 family glycosyl hydrolase [Saprospiraceae bacterium]
MRNSMKLIFGFCCILFLSGNLEGQLSQYVNPFIGTGGHGHTFPGPVRPFGMVQLGPDTRLEGWDGCSGYHYSDSAIYGFSHTHLSGTGVPDYCDILIQPGTGKMSIKNQFENLPNVSSSFKKLNEIAKAGFYSVVLDRYKIKVNLTSTLRTGLHEYEFSDQKKEKWIVIDLRHRDKVLSAGFSKIGVQQINGHRFSSSWASDQRLFFSLKTSHKIKKYFISQDSTQLICFFDPSIKKLTLQCALSPVDEKGAENNLQEEWAGHDFQQTEFESNEAWEKILTRIKIIDKNWTKNQFAIFYTALYHLCIHPSLYQDADGRYRGMDQKIHVGDKRHPRYTVFSLWDTYRAAHPFYQLVFPDYNYDFILSFLGQFEECGRLPVWELSGNETYCMIGNHSLPVMSYAYLDKNLSFALDKNKLSKAASATMGLGFSCLNEFRTGFISADLCSESVSKTLENSLDMAALDILIDRKGNEKYFYKNLYNPASGFFQAKVNQKFVNPFDPREVNFHYTEANAWQYVFGAHHDPVGMMACFESEKSDQIKNALELKLDALFTSESTLTGRAQSDITGLIGQYAHGNEPSHHVAYLYNYAGKHQKTVKYVSAIRENLYHNKPDGLSGNEDCGQMSAWYLWSTLGLYPVMAVKPLLDPGIPMADEITLYPAQSSSIVIRRDQTKGKKMVGQILHNKKNIQQPIHVKPGDKIVFEYSDEKNWSGYSDDWLKASNNTYKSLPYISRGDRVFDQSQEIMIESIESELIYFKTKSNPNDTQAYRSPIQISNSEEICFQIESSKDSANWPCAKFDPKPSGFQFQLQTEYASVYSAGGDQALMDGLTGSLDFRDGRWQGFFGKDIEAEIILDKTSKLASIHFNCLQDTRSWILLPSSVEFTLSKDGQNWEEPILVVFNDSSRNEESTKYKFEIKPSHQIKKIKIKIKNPGALPPEHISKGEPSWIFIDEIKLEKP